MHTTRPLQQYVDRRFDFISIPLDLKKVSLNNIAVQLTVRELCPN